MAMKEARGAPRAKFSRALDERRSTTDVTSHITGQQSENKAATCMQPSCIIMKSGEAQNRMRSHAVIVVIVATMVIVDACKTAMRC
jgi:hypothetical protein